MMTERRAISEIRVENCYRKTLGDLSGLIASIEDVGLLHPVVITADGLLIAGQRRIAACREMSWSDVPVNVVETITDAAMLLRAERDENTCRIPMSRSESTRLGMALEAIEGPEAAKRKAATQAKPGERVGAGKSPAPMDLGDTRDKVGDAIGMSGRTYEKGKLVITQADAGDTVAVEALKEMDETGEVDPAYKKVKKSMQRAAFNRTVEDRATDTRTQRQRDNDNKAFERWQGIIGTLDGITEALPAFRLERAAYVATAEELKQWDEVLGSVVVVLRAARKRLVGGT